MEPQSVDPKEMAAIGHPHHLRSIVERINNKI